MLAWLRRNALDLAAFIWGVAEATLFFFVPDVLLSYIGLNRGMKAAARASVIAAIGASVGGIIMYLWSVEHFEVAYAAVLAAPAISDSMAERALASMIENWPLATFLGPLSSTPFKVYAILAPAVNAPLPLFALWTIAARLPRFLIVSIGVAFAGRFLSHWLSDRRRLWLFIGAWLLFYAVFFSLMPN
jgi:membrane protein YqaA with SNARE-associated domain